MDARLCGDHGLAGLMHAEAAQSGIGTYPDSSGPRSNKLLHSKSTPSGSRQGRFAAVCFPLARDTIEKQGYLSKIIFFVLMKYSVFIR